MQLGWGRGFQWGHFRVLTEDMGKIFQRRSFEINYSYTVTFEVLNVGK